MRQLLWFKQDLRLDDHPAIQAAVHAERLLPVYILDTDLLRPGPFGSRRLGVHRARFLLESLAALDGELRQRGSTLMLIKGKAEQIIPRLVDQFSLQEVLTLEEIAPEEQAQLAAVRRALVGVPLRELAGNHLLRRDELPCTLEQLPPLYSQFRELIEQRLLVFQPHSAPTRLPALPETAEDYCQPLPNLSQLGLGELREVPNNTFPFSGGEPAAQARLRDYLWLSQGVRQYKDTRNGLMGSEYSSKFSPWLANGSLSPRRAVAELRRHESQFGRNESTHDLWLEILWRDFFRW
ncbi:MAG TPA: deoxyribodipyrimidine photo-lyase, partial [Pseudomonas sp.]|nr:deoxyribodipyrimidine photo-lyase [Pseudomonas sp.]